MKVPVRGHLAKAGSVAVVRQHRRTCPISDAARDWLSENVGEPGPGRVYTYEPRQSQTILRAALEAAGVTFIAQNGGGPGVRLKE